MRTSPYCPLEKERNPSKNDENNKRPLRSTPHSRIGNVGRSEEETIDTKADTSLCEHLFKAHGGVGAYVEESLKASVECADAMACVPDGLCMVVDTFVTFGIDLKGLSMAAGHDALKESEDVNGVSKMPGADP